jgi:hypothetical protein
MTKLRLGYSLESKYLLHLTPLHDYFHFVPIECVNPTDLCLSEILQPANTKNPIIVNNLFEQTRKYNGNELHLKGKWFFWANEYYLNTEFGRDKLETFSTTKSKLALMPMGRVRDHRTQVVNKLKPLLKNIYWSYRERGVNLPFDKDLRDRYLEPLWYQDTYTSVVCETAVLGEMFVTEKTFKPLCYNHPLLIVGNQYTLKALREQGFATFDNIFDESYDEEEDVSKRIDSVYNNLMSIDDLRYDSETIKRIKHNREHFYNKQRVDEIITNEIVNPILEYAETR